MAEYTRRVQAVLTEDQFALLSRLSEAQGKPVSALVREAVERTYVDRVQCERRHAALAMLLALEAPVADWEQMEAEIVRGATCE